MSSPGSDSSCNCPDCETRSLYRRVTLRGLLWGIFCFPCGLYCCLKRREAFCRQCHCEVVKKQPLSNTSEMGYHFRNYKSTTEGVPMSLSEGYRNAALSLASNDTATTSSVRGGGDLYDSQTELVRPQLPSS